MIRIERGMWHKPHPGHGVAGLLLVGAVLVFSGPVVQSVSRIPESSREGLRLQLLEATNLARKGKGLTELAPSDALAAAAQAHAQDMLLRRYFAHLSPEREGPAERVSRTAPEAIVLGIRENITRTEEDNGDDAGSNAEDVIDGWLSSPGHRQNLLSAESTHVGFGIASTVRRGTRTELVVQVLGIEAGRWERAAERSLKPPCSWRARLLRPLEFFLEDLSRPHRSYTDPSRPSVFWKGGRPLAISESGSWTLVGFPAVDPGRFALLARLEGDVDYQKLLTLTVPLPDPGSGRRRLMRHRS